MVLLIAALAVYKFVQVLESLTPREAMPWVKLLVSTVMGFAAAAVAGLPNLLLSGFAVATLAGGVHTLLRLLTLMGDLYRRPNR